MSVKNSDVTKIQTYLESQNRPYSSNDIFLNLHKEIGKTAVQKCLDQLAANGQVKEKVYGKQKVYVTEQSHFQSVDEGQLKELEKKVSALSEDVKSKQQGVQQAEAALKTLLSTQTTEEAQQQANKFEEENTTLSGRLQELQQNQTLVSAEERTRVSEQRTKALAEWRKRRRLARDVLDAILEGYPNSKSQLYEEIGIETDEELGVKMPT
uniref:Homologous-pairing protein 2 homolog n=1 Tax=Hirondellea gigas TaxID=1518452 RepID=A0A2P2I6L5_9CRUS